MWRIGKFIILQMRRDAVHRVLLASGFAVLGLFTQARADIDHAIFAAYCAGYYKYTVHELQRSLNESREWAQRSTDRPLEDRRAWQKVIDTNQRELQGEMRKLDRLQSYLARSPLMDESNNLLLAIPRAEVRAQDDVWACFNEAAPPQELPPSCERVRRCRDADNIAF
jgi:hypothetical protein